MRNSERIVVCSAISAVYLDRLEARFYQLKAFDKIEHDFGCVRCSELRRKLQTAELSVTGQRADNFAMASYDLFLHFSIFEKIEKF